MSTNTDINNNTDKIKLTYYEKNKEKVKEYQKNYNKLHQKECVERNKKYYDKEYYRLYYHRKLSPKLNNVVLNETNINI